LFNLLKIACEEPVLLILDDVTAIPRSLEPVLLRLILERVVGDDRPLHEGTRIVCIGNPSEYAPAGVEFSAAALNRVAQMAVEPSVEEVAAWFMGEPISLAQFSGVPEGHDVDASFREWGMTFALSTKTEDLIQFTPPPAAVEGGEPWASPRGWELGLRALAGLGASPLDGGVKGKVARALLDGTVGEAMAVRFIALLREASYLPPVEEIVANPTKAEVPTERKRQIAAISHLMRVARVNLASAWYYSARLDDEIKAVCTRVLPALTGEHLKDKKLLAHYTGRMAELAVAAGISK
jgi:MoxR-like ATPase